MVNKTPTDTTDELSEVGSLGELELDDIKRKSVSGAASYMARTIFLQMIGLASISILSAYLSKEDFGIYGYVVQFIGILTFFADIGLAASLIQKKEQPTQSDYRTTFTVQQILSWLIFGTTVALSQTQLITGPAIWILLALGISFPLASFKTISSIRLERRLDFSKLVIPQVAEQIVFNGILIFLVLRGDGVISYAYAILARSLIGTVIMFALEPWPIGLELNIPVLKKLINFGGKFQVNDLLARIKDNLFLIVLFRFMTPGEYGYMSWAKQWSMYPYQLTVNNVMAVTFPTFSRLQNNKQALKRAIEKSLFFITLAIFPIIVGMSLFIGPLTVIIPSYAKWQPAVFSFVLFTLAIGWSAISTPLINTLNAIGKINSSLKLMVLWTIMTWIITPICLKLFGFNGVAIASLIIAFTSFIPVLMVQKVVTIEFFDQIWRQLVAVGVMGFVGVIGLNFWSMSLSMMALGMILTGVAYSLSFLILGRKKFAFELGTIIKNRKIVDQIEKVLWL